MIKLPTEPCHFRNVLGHGTSCPYCAGTGRAHGRIGPHLRLERESRFVSRLALLRHFWKPEGGTYNETYVIDLEKGSRPSGKRQMRLELVHSYLAAIDAVVAERLSKTDVKLASRRVQ